MVSCMADTKAVMQHGSQSLSGLNSNHLCVFGRESFLLSADKTLS